MPHTTTECPVCGLLNGDHYNLCSLSPAYYSAEQERFDDAHYGEDDVRERYAGELIGLDIDEPEAGAPPVGAVVSAPPAPVGDDDIPF